MVCGAKWPSRRRIWDGHSEYNSKNAETINKGFLVIQPLKTIQTSWYLALCHGIIQRHSVENYHGTAHMQANTVICDLDPLVLQLGFLHPTLSMNF